MTRYIWNFLDWNKKSKLPANKIYSCCHSASHSFMPSQLLLHINITSTTKRAYWLWVTDQHWRYTGLCYGGTSTQTLSKSSKNLNPCLYQILPHFLLLVCCHRIWFMLRYILVWNLFSQLIINEMQKNTKCLWYCWLSTTKNYENP